MNGTYGYDTDVLMDDGTVIHTTVTNSGDAVKLFLQEIRATTDPSSSAWTPSGTSSKTTRTRKKKRTHRMAVLQLCVGRRCLIFQIVRANYVPAVLGAFLGCPDHRFVGVAVDGDIRRLRDDCGLAVADAMDLRHLAAEVLSRPELKKAGLKTLTREVMGVVIGKEKEVTMSKWDQHLTLEQVQYASIDAFVSYEVGRRLLTGRDSQSGPSSQQFTNRQPDSRSCVLAAAMNGTYGYDADVVMDDGTVIHTTVTNSGDAVKRFLREIHAAAAADLPGQQRPLIVGLDTEWRAVFVEGNKKQTHRMAVLQLCVGRRCLVFQIIRANYVPAVLGAFLACPDHRFVGVAVDGDVRRLRDDCGLAVANAVDLRHLAAEVLSRPELRKAGLKTLTREVMGVVIGKEKEVTMSKWEQDLTLEQVQYASIDAFVSYEVGRRLLTGHELPP
ncbi:hypothetical protein U9M48_018197 [Paspalum notatum var. saurae]|uniref:3'-5' exonuclease domain-containing protein n=1 Tax=Paspalum notatum var. saurae TaxID=547442 RepID=A0AAQ3T9K4_PASNO